MSIQVKRWKWNWIGHTLREGNEAIEREALDWNPQRKRRRGWAKQTWRSVHNEALEKRMSCGKVKRRARKRIRWRRFVDALCPLRDNRKWWWWWWWPLLPKEVLLGHVVQGWCNQKLECPCLRSQRLSQNDVGALCDACSNLSESSDEWLLLLLLIA